jgi:hypothetical protein
MPMKTPLRYYDNGDGTVTDKVTGLMWTKEADHGRMPWDKAVKYCEKLRLAGYKDWRLPQVRPGHPELDTLFRKEGRPSFEWEGTEGTPFTGVQDYYYWSATVFDYSTGYAELIYMENGLQSSCEKTSSFYVWPVRG